MVIVGKTIFKLHRVILFAPNCYNFQSAVLRRSIPLSWENRGMLLEGVNWFVSYIKSTIILDITS